LHAKFRTLERLTRILSDFKIERQNLQAQKFKLVSPCADEMRISEEIFNIRLNMGANLKFSPFKIMGENLPDEKK